MFEEQDVIMPEESSGQESALPEADVTPETPVETDIDTNDDLLPDDSLEEHQGEQQEEVSPFLKIKFNKEEMDLDEDSARELAQKGLNYDKIQERLHSLESDPRLSFVENLASEHGMSVDEYLDAVNQHREQQRLDELIQQNIPEELAKEILETRKFREQFEEEKQTQAIDEQRNKEFGEFFQFFREANGRDFNNETDQIPQSVWDAQANGVPLKYAYMEHHNNELKTQLKVVKQNKINEAQAPVGSLTTHGSTNVESEDDFLRGFNSI